MIYGPSRTRFYRIPRALRAHLRGAIEWLVIARPPAQEDAQDERAEAKG